ncbi:MAG: response regulator [Verrucomicrobia bacterium]|nr:response regulator [Verrucomicrobiota bacterium]
MKKHVLIIEDDHLVGSIYRQKLSMEGFQADVVTDGEAGIEWLNQHQTDLVLLDLMLPKVNGVDVLKNIRAKSGLRDTPVIVFSNAYLSNMVKDAWDAGATQVVSKMNTSPKKVVEMIRECLGGAQPAAAPPAAAPPAAALPAAAPIAADPAASDVQFQADLWRSCVKTAPARIDEMRRLLRAVVRNTGDIASLQEFYQKAHSMAGNTSLAGLYRVTQLSAVLEALLQDLQKKTEWLNQSTLRTAGQAIDLMSTLFQTNAGGESGRPPEVSVLVVDDDEIARRAVSHALQKANLRSFCVESPVTAWKMLPENRFDLVILDIEMPEMTGFELCTKLRSLASYQATPVLFLTTLSTFENRVQSKLMGGTDFVAKPFLYTELALKVLTFIFKAALPPPPKGTL